MVDRNHDGITYIALKPPVGLTLEETAKALADQVILHVNEFYQFQTKIAETNTSCTEMDGK